MTGTARMLAGGFFSLFILHLSGCAGTPQSRALLAHGAPGVELSSVPFFPQEDYQCGPAALATVLNQAGVTVSPAALTPKVYLPARRGSLQVELLAAARRYDRVPYVLRPDLEDVVREVTAGFPVLVLQNLGLGWLPRWHYAVVVGFDPRAGTLILRSGRNARRETPLKVFERTWRRGGHWAVVIPPPGVLPATAGEIPFLQSVVPLERLGRRQAAAAAYRAALERWPRSLAARIGLGNSYYAGGDLAAAEREFRTTTRTHPEAAPAFNNLAQTLADQGRWREAEQAARRAVSLGGPGTAAYRETLDQIRAQHMQKAHGGQTR